MRQDQAQSELKERVYSASEFVLQIHALDSTLDTEIKVLTAIDITDTIIKIAEDQVRLRERLKALTEEVEQLKNKVLE
jgi:hypothetical protein